MTDQRTSEQELELRRLNLDEEKERNSVRLRERELEIESRKADIASSAGSGEVGKNYRLAALSLLAGISGALATIGAALLSGLFSVQQTEVEGLQAQSLEQQKFSYELIQIALSEVDDRTRARRLRFMVDIGLLSNLNDQRILDYANAEEERIDAGGGAGESLIPRAGAIDPVLGALFPNVSPEAVYIFSDEAISLMAEKGIFENSRRAAAFFSLLAFNTGGLITLEERANYTASRLKLVFPSRYPDDETAERDAGNPERILNRVYAGRFGNDQEGDGWRYRGRGFILLTGRDNYRRIGQEIGVDIEADPDLGSDPNIALRIALHYFTGRTMSSFTAMHWADLEQHDKVLRVVSGSTMGLIEFRDWYGRISNFLTAEEFSEHPIVKAVNQG